MAASLASTAALTLAFTPAPLITPAATGLAVMSAMTEPRRYAMGILRRRCANNHTTEDTQRSEQEGHERGGVDSKGAKARTAERPRG